MTAKERALADAPDWTQGETSVLQAAEPDGSLERER
jgi:hypothetical protein